MLHFSKQNNKFPTSQTPPELSTNAKRNAVQGEERVRKQQKEMASFGDFNITENFHKGRS